MNPPGQYVLYNVTEYNEKEGYAVEQGYMGGKEPTPGFLIHKYSPKMPEDNQLSFPYPNLPERLEKELAATHGANAPIPE